MIFCKKCGRYYTDGTPSCGACGADLALFGHATFRATPVHAPVNTYSARAAAVTTFAARAGGNDDTAVAVATAVEEPPDEIAAPESTFDRDRFLLRQKALAIKEKYYVTDDTGSPLMFVERPALLGQQLLMLAGVASTFFGGTFIMSRVVGILGATPGSGFAAILGIVGFLAVLAATAYVFFLLVPKRHITFYTDDSKTEKLLEIRQLNKFEFPFKNFSILDAQGDIIGSLRKNVLFDYIRRRWQVLNRDGMQLCIAKEDSIILSLLRRTGIPIFLFLRTNFIFLRGDEVIGEFNRKLTLLDRYVLDLTSDRERTFDRRIALALGVMLDTGERR
jgi:uncharacterized protein YxjI